MRYCAQLGLRVHHSDAILHVDVSVQTALVCFGVARRVSLKQRQFLGK